MKPPLLQASFRHKPASDLNKPFSSSAEWIISHSWYLGIASENVSVFPAKSVKVNEMVAFRDQSQHKMVRTKEHVLPTNENKAQTNKQHLLLIRLMHDFQLKKKKLLQFSLLNSDMDCRAQLHYASVLLSIITFCKKKILSSSTSQPVEGLCGFSLFFFLIHSSKLNVFKRKVFCCVDFFANGLSLNPWLKQTQYRSG